MEYIAKEYMKQDGATLSQNHALFGDLTRSSRLHNNRLPRESGENLRFDAARYRQSQRNSSHAIGH